MNIETQKKKLKLVTTESIPKLKSKTKKNCPLAIGQDHYSVAK